MSITAPTALAARHETPRTPLKIEALALLRQAFAKHDHYPNSDQLRGLEALVDTFDRIVLRSDVTPALYLSALDPGVGKTTTLVAYVTALLRSEEHRGVGVLICLSRLTEIRRLAEALFEAGSTVAIRTSNDDLNALSNVADPEHAQVLIITQQRLERIGAGSLQRSRAFWSSGRSPRRPVSTSVKSATRVQFPPFR